MAKPTTTITREQRKLHVMAETAAVVAVAPFLFWAASMTDNPHARDGLHFVALTTLAIDGYLLWRFTRKR